MVNCLVNTLTAKLGTKRTETLFSQKEVLQDLDEKGKINTLAGKLDKLANELTLSPYDAEGNYKGKLLPVSGAKIEPTYTICPTSRTLHSPTYSMWSPCGVQVDSWSPPGL